MWSAFSALRQTLNKAIGVHLPKIVGSLPKNGRELLLTSLVGIGSGLIAVAFQLLISWSYLAAWVPLSQAQPLTFLGISFVLIMSTSLVAGWLVSTTCPEAAGSGIPQLKYIFWKDFGFSPLRLPLVKFLAGVLTIGGGSSLGREGPTVQITATFASNLVGLFGVAKHARRPAMAAGAAAGLAAAFNTPISAITFVLEEIIGDLNSTRYLSQALLAAVLATFVTHLFIGKDPAFPIPAVSDFSPHLYLVAPLVAAAAAFTGGWFQKIALGWRSHIRRHSKLPSWARPAVGALLTWVLGVTVYFYFHRLGVFGLGYFDLADMLALKVTWEVCAILLLAKFIATVASYAWGGCGGIFAPTLFLGSAVGLIVAGLVQYAYPLNANDGLILAVVGMSACLGAVVRAPLTSILIVFEMTHEFSFVPLLLLGTIVSQGVSRLMNRENFYSEVLQRDGIRLERHIPPRTLHDWQQKEVSSVANFEPVTLKGLDEEHLKEVFQKQPHSHYPVTQQGHCLGVVLHADLGPALANHQSPALKPVQTIFPDQTIAEARLKLLENSTGILALIHREDNRLLGILTLHDLLRAEMKTIELQED